MQPAQTTTSNVLRFGRVQGDNAIQMADENFFDEQLDQSETKARIVQKYFYTWAKVIGPSAEAMDGRIAYIDLFCGPGRYKDGAASTPLLVLEHAISDEKLRDMLVSIFNDADENHTATLQTEIDKLPGIKTLKYAPEVSCDKVGTDFEKYFNETKLIPSFTFVDPFGYKGLSLKIVNGVIKDWGCDCVFFFNYSRINAGITNPKVETHMDALFGTERAASLRALLPDKTPDLRQSLVLEHLTQAIKEMGGKFVLPFRFKRGRRLTHSLVFVSKHFRGYEIMKEIMAKESSTDDQGVPSFTYAPADASMPFLFSFTQPFDALKVDLPKRFAGQTLTMRQIYEVHSIDTPYLPRNYKQALRELDEDKMIVTDRPKRRKGTFADDIKVTFK